MGFSERIVLGTKRPRNETSWERKVQSPINAGERWLGLRVFEYCSSFGKFAVPVGFLFLASYHYHIIPINHGVSTPVQRACKPRP